jgi:hypothetical protein
MTTGMIIGIIYCAIFMIIGIVCLKVAFKYNRSAEKFLRIHRKILMMLREFLIIQHGVILKLLNFIGKLANFMIRRKLTLKSLMLSTKLIFLRSN